MKPHVETQTVPFASRHACRAITLIEALVVLAVIVLLAGMILPGMIRPPHVNSSRINCINNLKQIGIAFRLFATDHNDRFPQRLSTNEGGTLEFDSFVTPHFRVLSNEIATPKLLVCRSDSIEPATNFAMLTADNISYFVGMEVDETLPQMILAGDDNLVTNGVPIGSGWLLPRTNLVVGYGRDRHESAGNVVMCDGHAEQLNPQRLGDYLRQPPNLTNRFVLP